ncbi:MAG: PDZ domain-containing protein [Candidatus Acidiferrales bacterium]
MRVKTYIMYGVLAVAGLGVLAADVQSQTRQAAAIALESSAPAVTADCLGLATAQAEMQRDMQRFQREMKAQAEEMKTKAPEIKSEVAKEMVENGITNRAAMDKLSAQLHAQQAGITAEAQAAAAKAQELFAQNSRLLDASDDTGWLGVEISEVTPEKVKELKLPRLAGVIVSEVLLDSPSTKAGLETNDVILEYDGQPVEGVVQFRRLVRETPPGRSVDVEVDRKGHEQKLTVQVGNRARSIDSGLREVLPSRNFDFKFNMPEIFPGMTPTLGVEAEDVTGQLGTYFHVPGGEGVLIRDVSADSPAAKAGLRAGDVITRVDGKQVKTVGDLREHLREKRDQKSASLTIIRQGSQMAVTVTLEAPEPRRVITRAAAL